MEKNLADYIAKILKKSLSTNEIRVINKSHLHQNHDSSPLTGNSHFKVIIRSKELKSLSRVVAHQKIYSFLSNEMNEFIHALEIVINE